MQSTQCFARIWIPRSRKWAGQKVLGFLLHFSSLFTLEGIAQDRPASLPELQLSVGHKVAHSSKIGSVTSLKENSGSLKTTLSLQGGEKSPSGIDRPLAIRQVSETQGDMKTFKAKEG